MNLFTLKVVEIRKQTDDAITLCFKQPALRKIKYLAGQYLTLIFRINNRRYIRPYSFSSCANVDEFIEVTVKRVPGGIVSNHINDVVKSGDLIEVMPPLGDFIYTHNPSNKSVYLWGAGSGITPLISIAKQILYETDLKIHLNYCNRNREQTIFFEQINQFRQQFQNRFNVKYFYTQMVVDEAIPSLVQGRINQEKALQILDEDSDIEHSLHYICGPAGLKELVKNALALKNINGEQVFSEDFELIKNPEDFVDIHTQLIKLSFNQEGHELEVVKGQSVLEAALNAGIEIPYSCQTGSCSTCKGELIRGEAKMIGLTKERMDLTANEFLLCCTHPLTEDVFIKI